VVVVSPEDRVNFHSQAFSSTAPTWYRVAVFLWYGSGVCMLGFLVAGLIFRNLGLLWLNRVCGWGWGVSTLLFVFPMVVNSCVADPHP
jgi:hypothetical protein